MDDAVMHGMYIVQICFGLSDLVCEEQVWNSVATGRFVGVVPKDVTNSARTDAVNVHDLDQLPDFVREGGGDI